MWCCRDMGQALHSATQEGDVSSDTPTMADVIRERKKKSGISGSSLSTLRRRLAHVARRQHTPNDSGCDHARHLRSVVCGWRLGAVWSLHGWLSAGATLREVTAAAEGARPAAAALTHDLLQAYRNRWCADVEMEYLGAVLPAHRAILCARSGYFRALLSARDTNRNSMRVRLEGLPPHFSVALLEAVLLAVYRGTSDADCECNRGDLDIISSDRSTACVCSTCSGGVPAALVRRAAQELGLRGDSLFTDTRYLLDSGEYSDCRLVFRDTGQSRCVVSAHRVMLAARSRFFRGVMCRVSPCSDVCVDEKVLPRRFAAAILHAAYTDQVDLSLIGRNTWSPSATTTGNNTSNNNSNNKGSWSKCLAQLEDAFQLYEIARFLEMPIVAAGCEDALCRLLSCETVGPVLRWAAAPHASKWLHRQALRMVRESVCGCCAVSGVSALPRAALETALGSDLLQAAEADALRAVIRWGENQIPAARRRPERDDRDVILRHLLAPLLALVRVEHLPPDCDILQQAIRRGLLPAPPEGVWNSPDAWLGRAGHRPCRIFLPYLDEIKALVECQAVPPAEGRDRTTRQLQGIPDTLYMVAAERANTVSVLSDVLSPRLLRQLHARVNELHQNTHELDSITTQICLRAVREHALPDSCAALLLPRDSRASPELENTLGESSARSVSTGSLRQIDGARPTTSTEVHRDRSVPGSRGRLSLAVPDVAMAPNANTHLLTARDYGGGAVLQLDLGDGATHTPRPGSRAQRARHLSDQAVGRPTSAAVDDDELRSAMELSVIRAYSGYPRPVSPRPPLPRYLHQESSFHDRSPHISDRNIHLGDRNIPNSHIGEVNVHLSDRSAHNSRNVHTIDRNVHTTDRNARTIDRNVHTIERNRQDAHLSDINVHSTERTGQNSRLSDRSPHINERNLHLSDRNVSDRSLHERSTHFGDRSMQHSQLGDINVHLSDRSGQSSRLSDRSPHISERNLHLGERATLSSQFSDINSHLSDRSPRIGERKLQNSHTIDLSDRTGLNSHLSERNMHHSHISDNIAHRSDRSSRLSPHINERNLLLSEKPSQNLHLTDINLHLNERIGQNSHLNDRSPRNERNARKSRSENAHLSERSSRLSDRSPHLSDIHAHLNERVSQNTHLGGQSSHFPDNISHISDRSSILSDLTTHLSERNVQNVLQSDNISHISDMSSRLGDLTHLSERNVQNVLQGDNFSHISDRSSRHSDINAHLTERNIQNIHQSDNISQISDLNAHLSERNIQNAHLSDNISHISDRGSRISDLNAHLNERTAPNAHLSDNISHISDRGSRLNEINERKVQNTHLSENTHRNSRLSEFNSHLSDRGGQNLRLSDRSLHRSGELSVIHRNDMSLSRSLTLDRKVSSQQYQHYPGVHTLQHRRGYCTRPHDYRLEPSYRDQCSSRGHSPNNYA